MAESKTPPVPRAELRRERRLSWAWLVPVAALLGAAWLGYGAWRARGVAITIRLDEAHGLKIGDAVRYRGTIVGEVTDITLADDLDVLRIAARLRPEAAGLARRGSRFWVERPRLGLDGVSGLDTLLGPRYLRVLPGDGGPQRYFVGLGAPPVVETIESGDLEIILQADARGGLSTGAPLTYRGVPIGVVLSVRLGSDGGGVEARVHVDKAYAPLVRPESRFWDTSGVTADLGLGGLTLEVESLESVLGGGLAMATPPDAGEAVRTGHRFRLDPEPDDDWLEWEPVIAVGHSMLPPGAPSPHPHRATTGWEDDRWLRGQRSRRGWVLQTDDGLLGPADLLEPDENADRSTALLECAGQTTSLANTPAWQGRGLARRAVSIADDAWPRERVRIVAATEVEDCLVVGDPGATPLPLAASRLAPDGDGAGWTVDEAVPLDERWHGACVVGRRDGLLVGIVLVNDDDEARVALLPKGWAP